jgi:hypothetical protein
LSLTFNEKEYGKDVIVGINVKSFRPVVFLRNNMFLVYDIKYAPFRMLEAY